MKVVKWLEIFINEVLDDIRQYPDIALINTIYSTIYAGISLYDWNIKFDIYNHGNVLLYTTIMFGLFIHLRLSKNRLSARNILISIFAIFIGTNFMSLIFVIPLIVVFISISAIFPLAEMPSFVLFIISVFLGTTIAISLIIKKYKNEE